ncbi:MAG: hypothetical protein AB7N65_26440 [Vicinamibacterales bacterium]
MPEPVRVPLLDMAQWRRDRYGLGPVDRAEAGLTGAVACQEFESDN